MKRDLTYYSHTHLQYIRKIKKENALVITLRFSILFLNISFSFQKLTISFSLSTKDRSVDTLSYILRPPDICENQCFQILYIHRTFYRKFPVL